MNYVLAELYRHLLFNRSRLLLEHHAPGFY